MGDEGEAEGGEESRVRDVPDAYHERQGQGTLREAQRQKLATLKHELGGYVLRIEAIDEFVSTVLAQAGEPPKGTTPADRLACLVDGDPFCLQVEMWPPLI